MSSPIFVIDRAFCRRGHRPMRLYGRTGYPVISCRREEPRRLSHQAAAPAAGEASDSDKAGAYEVIPPEDGRGDLIPASSDVASIPVLVGGGLPFTSMENLMNENYEDGTYTYEDMTQDGSVLVVDMAFQSLRTNETVEEYAEYAAQFAALDTGEGEPRDVTCFQDEDYTQNLSYPVYIVWYTTGSGEDQGVDGLHGGHRRLHLPLCLRHHCR